MNETICSNHNDILFYADQIKKENLTPTQLKLINSLIKVTKCAKKQGVRMEKRLSKYRNSIEKLGFSREY
jgi:hypothetical protein